MVNEEGDKERVSDPDGLRTVSLFELMQTSTWGKDDHFK